MKGVAIISHGLQSSAAATKATALSDIGESLGWQCIRPDYQDIDQSPAHQPFGDVVSRIERLAALARQYANGPLVLAGSSMGAFISAHVSLIVPVLGLYLMAPPAKLQNTDAQLKAAAVPTWILHGWNDELIPADDVVRWAKARNDRLLLVKDGHRLADHVDFAAADFGRFLQSLA